jgi:hypothetical protein
MKRLKVTPLKREIDKPRIKKCPISYVSVGGECPGIQFKSKTQIPPYSIITLNGANKYNIIIKESDYFVSEDHIKGFIALYPKEELEEYCKILEEE